MQGSKLPAARLWIAGVSTVAILLGCDAQPLKDQAANTRNGQGAGWRVVMKCPPAFEKARMTSLSPLAGEGCEGLASVSELSRSWVRGRAAGASA